MATPSGKRAFWMHQLAEYVIAAVFVAQGLQSVTPAVPTLCGGMVLLNTACAKGPLSAFRVFGRKMHRLLDLVVIAVVVVMAVQPAISLDNSTRVIMGVLAFVLAFIWLGSDFSESERALRKQDAAQARLAAAAAAPTATTSTAASAAGSGAASGSAAAGGAASGVPRRPSVPRPANDTVADTVGRTAGRLAGKGVNLYRDQAAKRRKK
ncbi:MAG: hypothetical protein JWM34_4273 [Ilumatobacteraceae bacterium]|nr:hypothetical protein [Ilumatobacteraceae bacterium]